MSVMNMRTLSFPLVFCGIAALSAGCDSTLHQYPSPGESVVLVELNVDRTPPRYYKELTYDSRGEYRETPLAPERAEAYTPDERLGMRLVTELYRLHSPEERIDRGELVARREVTVDRLQEAPQDTLQFHVPQGFYRALTWADYTPKNDPGDWHFDTPSLDAVRVDVDHKPRDNHHKSSAAGSRDFSVDFGRSATGAPVFPDGTRAEPARDHVVPVYLERASGRFRLWATDLQEFLNSGNSLEDLRVEIVYRQYVSAGYNVATATPNRFVRTRTMETRPTTVPGDGSVLLAYDYVLTSDDREDRLLADVFVYRGDDELNHYQNITIPLRRNRETVVKGPFLTREIGSGDIGIDDGFDDEFVEEVPD